jgi:hypothetical protein
LDFEYVSEGVRSHTTFAGNENQSIDLRASLAVDRCDELIRIKVKARGNPTIPSIFAANLTVSIVALLRFSTGRKEPEQL